MKARRFRLVKLNSCYLVLIMLEAVTRRVCQKCTKPLVFATMITLLMSCKGLPSPTAHAVSIVGRILEELKRRFSIGIWFPREIVPLKNNSTIFMVLFVTRRSAFQSVILTLFD
jgi:hypothetical protein